MSIDRQAVKQLDHIIVRADDPQPLFKLLSETLGLPVAWPLRSYPPFTSGGGTLGNLYLEILSVAAQKDSSSHNSPDARFAAFAFEADPLAQAAEELVRRKIPHGPVTPYVQREADGRKTKLYSNIILGKMLGRNFWIDTMILMGRLPGASAMADPGAGGALVRWGMDKVMSGNLVFLVEHAYGEFADLPHWSEFKNHQEKRAADKATLATGQGGALGVESVKEIVAGVKDFDGARKCWEKFLEPTGEMAQGVWEIADSPAVHLVPADESLIQALVIKVSSLKKAETFLTETSMLGALEEGQVTIAPEKIYGLDVRLVE
ncbi:MAG: hypothetical protein QOH63_2338 [Acidobacteriota bacterium]|jgi:hypothetical protein|nr:hypothetical protein [Acidobacteriota bacterium]